MWSGRWTPCGASSGLNVSRASLRFVLRDPRTLAFVGAIELDDNLATQRLQEIGAEIEPSNDEGLLRFRDPNGILVELKEA